MDVADTCPPSYNPDATSKPPPTPLQNEVGVLSANIKKELER